MTDRKSPPPPGPTPPPSIIPYFSGPEWTTWRESVDRRLDDLGKAVVRAEDRDVDNVREFRSFRSEIAGWFKELLNASGNYSTLPAHVLEALNEAASEAAPKPLVLLVEDDKLLSRAYTNYFEHERWDVRTVDNEEEAIAAIRDRLPSLVVLDNILVAGLGINVFAALRSMPEGRGVHVIVISGHMKTTDRQGYHHFNKGGPLDIVNKERPDELEQALRDAGKNGHGNDEP